MDHSTFTNWRKSRRSSGGDNCVEIAIAADSTVGVRDSKNRTGPVGNVEMAFIKHYTRFENLAAARPQ